MNSSRIPILIVLGCIIGSLIIIKYSNKKNNHAFLIGILQTASHPELDKVQHGFTTTLKNKLKDRVDFIIKNAQGDINSAYTIAQQFHHTADIAGIFAIATPALQAIATIEHQKPIVFAAVTNPALVVDIAHASNITGVTDMLDHSKQVQALLLLKPTVKAIGVLLCPAELNSVQQAHAIQSSIEHYGLTCQLFNVHTHYDIPIAFKAAIQHADAIIVPSDNLLASAANLLIQEANKYKIPLVMSHISPVYEGALMAYGVNYKDAGSEAAHKLIDILLHGKTPSQLPIDKYLSSKIYINAKTVALLGLTIPERLKLQAVVV